MTEKKPRKVWNKKTQEFLILESFLYMNCEYNSIYN